MPLGRNELARLIPHRGAMCLLDRVVAHDATSIVCAGTSHRSPENPLRQRGRLGVLCGLEYAAQAVAVHGGLLAHGRGNARPGYLAGTRDLRLHVQRLDDIESDLLVRAERLTANDNGLLYTFSVCADERMLLQGRLSIFFSAPTTANP